MYMWKCFDRLLLWEETSKIVYKLRQAMEKWESSTKMLGKEENSMTITELCEKAHKNARDHGFWEDWDSICWEDGLDRNEASTLDIQELFNSAIAKRLMLIVSELGEALEALRNDDRENFAEELADVAIRLGDLCGGLNIDLETEIKKKMEKNKTRGYKHGKLF
jgi:NTP pyrophosphatase (non-canonical NTP hydrolase)